MNKKHQALDLGPKRKTRGNAEASTVLTLPDGTHVILPDANGDAIGLQDSDANGIAVAMNGRTAQIERYGVAYCPAGGTAKAGAGGAAISHYGGATAGDGAMAYTWGGVASAYQWSAAYARQGAAQMNNDGVAVMLLSGLASVAEGGGVACALNFSLKLKPSPIGIPLPTMETDPTAGAVSAGIGSVVVAFTLDKKKNRRPVVGFIGDKPDFLNNALNLEMELLGCGVQFGLKPKIPYRLNAKTGRFEVIPKAKRKSAKWKRR